MDMNEIKDMDKIMSLKFSNGILMYPFFRWSILGHLERKNRTQTQQTQPAEVVKDKWIKRFFTNIIMCRIRRKKLLFLSSTLFNIKDGNGKYVNQLDGYYYSLYPNDSLLVENSDGLFNWRTRSSYKNLSFINSYLIFISYLIANISSRLLKVKNTDLVALNRYVEGWSSLSELKLIDRQVCIYQKLVRWFFKRCKCKVVFVNCGCYGDFSSVVIHVAKKLGIRTVELQHGLITKNHYAYNPICKQLEEEIIYQYLPDEIWTFGEYWSDNVGWKIRRVPIGNPHITYSLKKHHNTARKYDYLIISQWTMYNEIKNYVGELAAMHPGDKIAIRLHPSDKLTIYDDLTSKYKNVIVTDSSVDLYKDFAESDIVIGGYSTCLYEALAFQKRLVIIDCELSKKYFDNNIGRWSKTPNDLDDRITETTPIKISEIWNTNFEYNVKYEINRLLNN